VDLRLSLLRLEMMVASMANWDIARFGSESLQALSSTSDLMIVAGTLTKKMAPWFKRIYEQIARAKWVIAYGACACSGGIFKSYSVVQEWTKSYPLILCSGLST